MPIVGNPPVVAVGGRDGSDLDDPTASRAAARVHPRWNESMRWMLIALFTVFAAGRYPVAIELSGFAVQAWRVVAIAALVMLFGPRRSGGNREPSQFFLLMAGVWIGWGLVSFAWTPSLQSGLVELAGLVCGLTLTLTVATMASSSRSALETFAKCWTVAVSVMAWFGVAEYVTSIHLPSPFATQIAAVAPGQHFMTATFGNSNDYAAFLLAGLPFAIVGVTLLRHRLLRVAAGVSMVVAAGAIFLSNSRLCTLGLVVGAVAFFLMRKAASRGRSYRLRMAHVILLVLLVVAVLASPGALAKFRNLAAEWEQGGSLRDRLLLVEHGWNEAVSSEFRGIGIGGFEPSLSGRAAPLTSSGDINPHNFAMELLSQYGLLMFVLFSAWFTSVVVHLRSCRRELIATMHDDDLARRMATAGLVAAVMFIPGASDPSSFIEQGTGWLALGSLLAVSLYLRRRVPSTVRRREVGDAQSLSAVA